ncbi:MAG: hypothetical protein HMLIMOIP_000549 [Candidatus Nitrosomirales archaeon]|jgi:hypothetical protein
MIEVSRANLSKFEPIVRDIYKKVLTFETV